MVNLTSGTWLNKLSDQKDGLYEKLASPDEGWNIKISDRDVDVPLNSLDAVAYQILLKAIENKEKVALALPRVKIGVSLSIIAYLVVNRFIKQHRGPLNNFISLPLTNGYPVVIGTKNRKLRDFFLESSLRFNRQPFSFIHFPINRINRLGQVISLIARSDTGGLISQEPVIFYHFDNIDLIPKSLNQGYFIGELTEIDSPDLAYRLCRFVNDINASSSLVLVNEFSDKTIKILKENDFKIITLTSDDVLSTDLPIEKQNLPSLGSSLAKCPSKISLKINLIESEDLNSKLNKILQILLSLNKKLGSDTPPILIRAWTIFYALKDLAVPLDRLEQYRRKDTGLKTLKHNTEQLFNFPLNKLDEKYQRTLEPIWASLGSEINELYELLAKNSPKYLRLSEIVKKVNKSDQTWQIVFCSQAQSQVFKEELLINTDWMENESNLKVGYINDFINSSELCDKVILVGTWRKSDQAKLLSLFPQIIYLLCYGSELQGLSRVLNYLKWIKPDQESALLLDHHKEFIPIEQEGGFSFEATSWDPFGVEQEMPEEAELGPVTEAAGNLSDETIRAYYISLESGKSIFIPTEQEVYAYSDEEGTIESKLPEALVPGDVILLYSQDQNNEMFQNVIKRTQELSGVDPRVRSIWKTASKVLRESYDINSEYSVNAYLHDLQDLGCNKTTQTVKQWLKGLTLAPRDRADIEYLLTLAEFKNAPTLSRIIHREIELTRMFHRKMGKRLRERLGNFLKGGKVESSSDSIDREIDEILEMAEPVGIREVAKEVKYVPKEDVKINIFG